MKFPRRKLSGAFDLFFLFGRGVERFDGNRHSAFRSLLPLGIVFTGAIFFAAFYPPKGMEEGYNATQIVSTVAIHFTLSFFLSALAVAYISRLLKVHSRFWLFFEASNWTTLIASLLMLPFCLMAITGIIERLQADRLFAIFSIYGYIVTGCILFRALRVNWQLAGAITIVTLFISEELWHLLFFIQDIPDPW